MVRGLGDFQRAQIKRRDARIDLLFQHLHNALDTLQDIMRRPYEPPAPPTAPASAAPAKPVAAVGEPAGTLPEYATINRWIEISGMNRTAIYEAMKTGELKAIKVRRRTLIDVKAGLAWMGDRVYSPSGRILGRY